MPSSLSAPGMPRLLSDTSNSRRMWDCVGSRRYGPQKDESVLTERGARELAAGLARSARTGGPTDWSAGTATLADFDGRDWLLVDEAARSFTYASNAPVSGSAGWLSASVSEPSGFVAIVTSWHADGHI